MGAESWRRKAHCSSLHMNDFEPPEHLPSIVVGPNSTVVYAQEFPLKVKSVSPYSMRGKRKTPEKWSGESSLKKPRVDQLKEQRENSEGEVSDGSVNSGGSSSLDEMAIDEIVGNSRSAGNIGPEVGVIERITTRNFMCHTVLDFQFGANVNFILGKNGSGKSAILTAIVVGLGGTASATNRGTSVKNFIQNGKHTAEVAIRLCNKGDDAYKAEEYGETIRVERQIYSDGRSVYRLKSHLGKVICEKKDELIRILDHFNIQVENPICVLNQELSRSFLQAENPKKLYKLFLRATQLDQVKTDYDSATEMKQQAVCIFMQKKRLLPDLEAEVEQWRQKWEYHESMADRLEKLDKLKQELQWSRLEDLKSCHNEQLNILQQRNENLEKLTGKHQRAEEALKESDQKLNECIAEVDALKTELDTIRPQHTELKAELKLKKQLHANAELECRKIRSEVQAVTKDKEKIVQRIQELRETEFDSYEREKQQRVDEINMLEQRCQEAKARLETQEAELEQLKNAVERSRQEVSQFRREEQTLNSRLMTAQQKVANLEASRTNTLSRFGQWVPDAVAHIQKACEEGRFRKMPRGPLGAYVKSMDARWNLAIESCIKFVLFSFCCDNHADARLLENILTRVGSQNRGFRMPAIITSQFSDHIYDVSQHRVRSSKYPSILDKLSIDDPVVANCLIDQCQIECIILIEDGKEARRVMLSEVPRNCKECYTLAGDQIYPSPNFRYYSSRKNTAHLLQENVDTLILNHQKECELLESEKNAIRSRIAEMNAELSRNSNEAKATEMNCMRVQDTVRNTTRRIHELKSANEEPEPAYLASLEVDLKMLDEQLGSRREDLQQAENALRECREEVLRVSTSFKEMDGHLSDIVNSKMDPLTDTLRELEGQKATYEDKVKRFERDVQAEQAISQAKGEECHKQATVIQEYTEKLLTQCGSNEAPATPRKPDVIEKQINKLKAYLDAGVERYGDKNEVAEQYRLIKIKADKIKDEFEALEAFLKKFDGVLAARHLNFEKLRQYIYIKVRQHFVSELGVRGFQGDLDVDFGKDVLTITVLPKGRGEEATKDMRALSGGERSFSTVCFILALWESMEAPFRMLDEFDVFLDMVNRKVLMQMMLDTALSKRDKQFIFLTPLEMSHLKATNSVRILKMRDPERNQGVLPF